MTLTCSGRSQTPSETFKQCDMTTIPHPLIPPLAAGGIHSHACTTRLISPWQMPKSLGQKMTKPSCPKQATLPCLHPEPPFMASLQYGYNHININMSECNRNIHSVSMNLAFLWYNSGGIGGMVARFVPPTKVVVAHFWGMSVSFLTKDLVFC